MTCSHIGATSTATAATPAKKVLLGDSATEPVMHPERICRVVNGRWWSSYDDVWTTNPSDLHVDHLVPLAEAWESGARLWSAQQREAFANDPAGLIAVSAASTAKGVSDPADWLPPNEDVRCVYAAVSIEAKTTWGVAADTRRGRAAAARRAAPAGTPPRVRPADPL